MLEQMQEDDRFTDIDYTDDFGEAVMNLVDRRFDAEYGVCWESVENAIEEIINQMQNK